ncbi:hypothetical protein GCM10011579_095690 [Streptomyces albiflavescens]|uniref:NADPH:quinone reductase n=1 Tax=Streptomyces albiflavescens TaxID=1623582 RepID=A0A918DBC6_9ACTN|nr:hypothetical protein GCM10011579_095690 [Streptomyces albiflavescens]
MALDSKSTVLINGAAGGVGHLALQLAKWKGARVIAVASGAHETFLRELGADEFIDYTKERPEEVVRDVDLVLDTVGGPDSRRFLRTLKRGGSLYPVYFGQFDDEENAKLGVTVTAVSVRSSGAQLAELQSLVDAGKIRVAIDSRFPLADARAAHERVARGAYPGQGRAHGRLGKSRFTDASGGRPQGAGGLRDADAETWGRLAIRWS